jgi:hypothetical protein
MERLCLCLCLCLEVPADIFQVAVLILKPPQHVYSTQRPLPNEKKCPFGCNGYIMAGPFFKGNGFILKIKIKTSSPS